MSRHDVRVTLAHMRDHAREAIALLSSRSRDDLDTDRVLELAMTRLLEIVDEAASRVPRDQQAQLASIPWSDVIGIRHRIIHGYDAVDHDIIWQTVRNDLPTLVDELNRLLK